MQWLSGIIVILILYGILNKLGVIADWLESIREELEKIRKILEAKDGG